MKVISKHRQGFTWTLSMLRHLAKFYVILNLDQMKIIFLKLHARQQARKISFNNSSKLIFVV